MFLFRYISVLVFLITVAQLPAQDLSQRVSFEYHGDELAYVLQDISNKYNIHFAYSRHFIPLEHPVNVAVEDETLFVALEEVFEGTPVVFRKIGHQIALKSDKTKVSRNIPEVIMTQTQSSRRKGISETRAISPIPSKEVEHLPGGDSFPDFDPGDLDLVTIEPDDQSSWGQVSVVPSVATNGDRSTEITNTLSLNLFWGSNGGVDGLEVGGFVNKISNDVKGVQVAGLGNKVGGSVSGTQVAGLFNVNGDYAEGVQAAGLFNISDDADAVQMAGLFNRSGDFYGVQGAGLFNYAEGEADGLQVAGGFNMAEGKVKTQVSGLFNVATDVKKAQVSSLLNVAHKVEGFQLGLINIADTTSSSIGLLNIIKKGYNRVEFSASEALYGNFALKLGTRNFYNIIHLGARYDQKLSGPGKQFGDYFTWGLGYGIGASTVVSPKSSFNFELVATQVNEGRFWTPKLNLLNRIMIHYDYKIGKRTSLFAGPVLNIMTSKLYDEETQTYGSHIVPYTFYDKTKNGNNVKMWAGINAGIRF